MQEPVWRVLPVFLGAFSAWLVIACGRPSGEATNYAGYERPGIVSGVLPSGPNQQELQKLQQQLNETSSQLGTQEQQENDLTFKINDVRRRIQAAQSQQTQLQSGVQTEMLQKTRQYAAQDIQAQSQQLELDIVRSQLENQIAAQKNALAELGAVIAQQRSWGFASNALENALPRYAEEQQKLAQLENQYWGLRQQAGQLAALQSQSQQWFESRDKQQTEQSYRQQMEDTSDQIQELQGQYDQLVAEQEKLRNSNADLAEKLRITRDNYQALLAQTG